MHPLIHDWNKTGTPRPATVLLDDETLRDGLQSPSVRCPTIDEKLRILHLIDRLGIETADIGLPGAGPHVVRDVERLAREIADQRLRVAPHGAAAVVRFIASVVEECGGGVGIDWHGHRDRDFAIINTLAALEAGATRLHGSAIGIGERVGNTPMELLLMNLVLMGYIERDLSSLVEYCDTVSAATDVPIPANYPVVGRDAFRTATGVHAAAVINAFKKNDLALVDAVYSGVPASLIGREQQIDVGPMSGKSNVVFWLERHGYAASDELVDRIFSKAKASSTVLTS